MAHWAELDENNIVIRVLVGNNDDPAGDEGYQWLIDNLGGRWMKTSFNATIRKKFAGIGDLYDDSLDAFINPKPFNSWVLNEETCIWEAPIQKPNLENDYVWNELTKTWDLLN